MKDGYRHEYKYLISAAAAELLKRRLPGMMATDPYAGPNGRYTIRSLYFDDGNYSAYEEKMSGVADRVKYRIRYYNYDTRAIRLEKKEKHGHLTRKTGKTITLADALHLQNSNHSPCPDTQGELITQLRCGISCGLRPAILVDYDRTPFVCNAGQTRITIDENIRTRPYHADLLASDKAMVPVLEEGMAILEVKFNDFLPGYLAAALEDIPKINIAVSKYVLCLSTI